MSAVCETKSPLLLGEKQLSGFGDDTAGNKGGKGQTFLGEEGRSGGVVRSILRHDCNF